MQAGARSYDGLPCVCGHFARCLSTPTLDSSIWIRTVYGETTPSDILLSLGPPLVRIRSPGQSGVFLFALLVAGAASTMLAWIKRINHRWSIKVYTKLHPPPIRRCSNEGQKSSGTESEQEVWRQHLNHDGEIQGGRGAALLELRRLWGVWGCWESTRAPRFWRVRLAEKKFGFDTGKIVLLVVRRLSMLNVASAKNVESFIVPCL